jgi:hypothetical protein
MKLVEEMSGVGEVTWQGASFQPVPYRISRFQAMTRAGLPVPGLHRIEGQLTLDGITDAARLEGGSVTLRLEDGRTMSLTVADEDGRVLAEGHGPSRCTCC